MKDLIVIRILMLFSAFWMPLAVNILIDEKIKWQKRLICSILSMISYILIFSQNSSEIMALIYFPDIITGGYFRRLGEILVTKPSKGMSELMNQGVTPVAYAEAEKIVINLRGVAPFTVRL